MCFFACLLLSASCYNQRQDCAEAPNGVVLCTEFRTESRLLCGICMYRNQGSVEIIKDPRRLSRAVGWLRLSALQSSIALLGSPL